MKRQKVILYLLFVLGLILIISSYISRKNLKETLKKEKEELPAQIYSRQGSMLPGAIREGEKFEETGKQRVRPEEKETDLQQIPDDYIYTENREEEPETEGPKETRAPQTSNLKKQPSASEIKELKSKGLIIY